ncbi:cgeb family protein [hydrocarbon metagenome]|uniref:Cgeb family protein n=1 Tax=hydrocarbon metagenome TaxID=938273 RepID=A0A0W8G4T6_9ZZZZ
MSERCLSRILVVLPMYGGSLPVGRYCAKALAGLGHLVETFEAPDFYGAFTAIQNLRVTAQRLDYLEHAFLQTVSQALLAKVETFEPDLVLAMAQAPLTRQALKRLRRDGVSTAMWFVEDHQVFTYWQAFAPFYDFFAVIQKEPFVSRLHGLGVENVLYLPMAADPDIHRPLDLTPAERRLYGSDLSFVGAGYPNRRAAFRELFEFDLKIWGSDWDGEVVLAPRIQFGGRRVSTEESVKVFGATTINLNLHSGLDPAALVPAGDFVNPRTFELAMCGAFQLVSGRELLPELFAPDEMAVFTDMPGLKEQAAHYLARPDERRAMAGRARARALSDHTYAARMRSLLDFVAVKRPGFGKTARREAGMAELPEGLRRELSGLLGELGLPGDAGFADVVTAVRSRQGQLTELETALLFLDEWRKQYGGR